MPLKTSLNAQVAGEIRAIMARRLLTGTWLAEILELGQPYISRRLSGKQTISLDDLELIADALGVSPGSLLGYGPPDDVPTQFRP